MTQERPNILIVTARLRAQVSAAHTKEHLDTALAAFQALRAEVL